MYYIIYMSRGMSRTKLLTTRNGHGQILCENRVSVSGWSPYWLWKFLHKFEHPKSTPYYFSLLLILSVTHISMNVYYCLILFANELVLQKNNSPGSYLSGVNIRWTAKHTAWKMALLLKIAIYEFMLKFDGVNMCVCGNTYIWIMLEVNCW